MARIPRSFARRARSTASIFLGTPSGSACACISIAPLRVCAFADSEKTRNTAASCDLMDVPFIEQVSLELGVNPDPKQQLAPRQCAGYATVQRGAIPRPEQAWRAAQLEIPAGRSPMIQWLFRCQISRTSSI